MTTAAQAKLHPRVSARLSTYATLAGVALAAPALTPSAEATIVYSGSTNINIPTTTAGIYLNVVTGVSSTTPAGSPGWDLNLWGTSTLFAYGTGTGYGAILNFGGGSSASSVDNLSVGTSINSTFSFGNGSVETTGTTAFNLNSTANYVGFRFLNEVTGQTDYGWAQLSLSSAYNGQPRSILGYAYENTGAFINVGQTSAVASVPDSGSTLELLAIAAAGAVAVRGWRSRRLAVA